MENLTKIMKKVIGLIVVAILFVQVAYSQPKERLKNRYTESGMQKGAPFTLFTHVKRIVVGFDIKSSYIRYMIIY